MTPNFCGWEAVKAQVGSCLQVSAASLPDAWDNVCSHSARRAAAELRGIFILKGYAADRMPSWDDCYTYSLQLATYFALTSGTALANYDVKNIEWMDIRKELREAGALIIDGVAVAPEPGESAVGGISSGQVAAVGLGMRRYDRRYGGRYPYDC